MSEPHPNVDFSDLRKRRNGDGIHCIDCPTGVAVRYGRCLNCARKRDRDAKRRQQDRRRGK